MKISRFSDYDSWQMNSIQKQDIEQLAATFPLSRELKGCRVIVTGATGLLGSTMVYALLAINALYQLGMRITIIVRNMDKARRLFGDKVDYFEYDFSSDKVFNLNAPADYFVHFASPTASRAFIDYPVETMRTIVSGMDTILQWSCHTPSLKALIDVSTLEVYGSVEDDSIMLTEEQQGYLDLLQTRSSYPMAKRTAECLCYAYSQEYQLPVRIARLAQTFGAGVAADDGRVFAHFARSAVKGDDIILHTEGNLCRSYCYTTDAISAVLWIMLRGKNGEAYNVANEDTYISIRQMAEMVCRELIPGKQVVVNLQKGMGYSPQTKLRLSTEKLRLLGWTPQFSLIEMFKRLVASMKEDYHE